ncbi:hypothetical protein ABW21_db0205140 [Orbilia brochopaga]|nr:hypothetical protein ABW21_db0205140 [Drechslerella brochopaga]
MCLIGTTERRYERELPVARRAAYTTRPRQEIAIVERPRSSYADSGHFNHSHNNHGHRRSSSHSHNRHSKTSVTYAGTTPRGSYVVAEPRGSYVATTPRGSYVSTRREAVPVVVERTYR